MRKAYRGEKAIMKHIFVLSTFKGMHSEREIVNKSIIPMLNEKADEYGEYIEYVDLRWECDNNTIKNIAL